MSELSENHETTVSKVTEDFDVVIIGGGISGMYQLYRLREMGLSVRVFEAGSGVGGTWYWNRYPGARFDSESYSYGYSFSEELLQEWEWSEHFAAQPETLRYLNYVADKFDLRKDIRFSSRIRSMKFDDTANEWKVVTENGDSARAPILVTAIGMLSAPNMPKFVGLDSFEGISFHTSNSPHDEDGFSGKYKDFSGMRVGVVGTGATGVQVIQEAAKTADELFVFQMVPEFCAPLGNSPIDEETQKKIKSSYPEIFKKCKESFGGFLHQFDPRSTLDVPPEEREAFFEQLYREPGFAIWLGNYIDTLSDKNANDIITEFIKKKIRARVNDPVIAEKLIPTTYGFGMRRVPMETNYYEAYNQDNVHLIDVGETPIDRITPKGIKVDNTEYELDLIIFSTGFDAVTGAFKRIDIHGKGGLDLQDKWADGPRTLLGMQTPGFPNMFTLVGPHNGATFCNIPRCIEQNVEWVTALIRYMRDKKYTTVEATDEAAEDWTDHVAEVAAETLFPQAASWFMGENIPGKKRGFLLYPGGGPRYRAACEEVAENDYKGFKFG